MTQPSESIEQKILNFKESLENDKTLKARLEGELASIDRRLKEEFACETIEQAKEKLATLQTNTETLQTKLEEETLSYEEKYCK